MNERIRTCIQFICKNSYIMLRHFYYMGRRVSVCASAPLSSTVLYLRVSIVSYPSHSLLPVYAGKYLYVVHMNKMINGNNNMKTKVISSNAKTYLRYVL